MSVHVFVQEKTKQTFWTNESVLETKPVYFSHFRHNVNWIFVFVVVIFIFGLCFREGGKNSLSNDLPNIGVKELRRPPPYQL